MTTQSSGASPTQEHLVAPAKAPLQTSAGVEPAVRIHQLTGLRFFAALLVFMSHLKWEHSWEAVRKVAEQGSVGVTFFFMLSGFVISYSYGGRLRSREISPGKYFALRFFRLWPLHVLTGLPFAVFLIWKGWLDVSKYGANLLFLQSWIPSSDWYFAFNGPSWSLSNEMFFYAAFIGLTFLSARQKVWLFGGLVAVIAAAMLGVQSFAPDLKIAGNLSLAHWLFYIFPLFRLDEFLLGMILFDLWKAGRLRAAQLSYVTIPLLLLAMYLSVPYVPEMLRYHMYYLPVVALLLVSFLSGTSRMISFFSTRTAVLLGEASFAFYLIHQPIVMYAEKARHKFGLVPSDLVFAAIMLAVCIAGAVAAYLLVERPIGNVIRRRIGRLDF